MSQLETKKRKKKWRFCRVCRFAKQIHLKVSIMKLLKSCTLAQVPPSSLPRAKRHEAGGEGDVFYSAAHKLYSITSLTQFGGPTQNKRA